MLNTTGDHAEEMSIKLCQTKAAFCTESKTRKRDGMRKGGSNKKEDAVNEELLESARVPERRAAQRAMVSPSISRYNYDCSATNGRLSPQQLRLLVTQMLCGLHRPVWLRFGPVAVLCNQMNCTKV